ncbi:MAG: AraC family transcriptional regulator [Clostridiales bacterium]|nr:AraC family transcriptional regulator [Clostridiales bacterium]
MDADIKFVFKRGRQANNLIPSHLHDEYELVYYERGAGVSTIEGVDYPYSRGQFCIIPPRTVHLERALEETVVICVAFSCHQGADLFESAVYDDPEGEIYEMVDTIASEMQSRRPMSSEIANGYLAVLLLKLHRLLLGDKGGPSGNNVLLYSAYNYICAYYNTDINFGELAASIGYSYDRFRHLFSERFGIAPKQLVLKKRIEMAKQMLQETDEKIQSIAYSCGFNSAAQLTVIFKNTVGIPPTRFRKNKKQG